MARKAQKAEDQLNDLDARLRSVAKEREDAKADAAALRMTGDELTAAQKAIRDLQKKVDDANVNIVDLQGDKAKLADKYDKLQRETDSRFAGIATTGRRVVFLVDMSGSMKLLADGVNAPDKWSTVVETVAKVMRSIPDLEQFQVVTFSRKAQYLFADGRWVDYQGEATARQVSDALRRIDPTGDTALYDGLDLAFRLKPAGLDTVYLFSDGLPTQGPGLAADEDRKLTDVARSEKLAKHILQTLALSWNRPGDGKRVRINSIGFFFQSPDVGAFLWSLSRENDGSFVGMSRP
jgi:chaperonin cofactor prefoldin